jgi:hypothetical protein
VRAGGPPAVLGGGRVLDSVRSAAIAVCSRHFEMHSVRPPCRLPPSPSKKSPCRTRRRVFMERTPRDRCTGRAITPQPLLCYWAAAAAAFAASLALRRSSNLRRACDRAARSNGANAVKLLHVCVHVIHVRMRDAPQADRVDTEGSLPLRPRQQLCRPPDSSLRLSVPLLPAKLASVHPRIHNLSELSMLRIHAACSRMGLPTRALTQHVPVDTYGRTHHRHTTATT